MTAGLLFAKLPFSFDLTSLRDALQKIHPQHWIDHVNQRDYAGGWQVLPLRCRAEHKDAHPILQGFAIESGPSGDDWYDLPLLSYCSEFRAVLKVLQCPLKSVRLMRLAAGASIMPHQDSGVAIDYGEARLHLPIEMDERLVFSVNDTRVPMTAGELWYINADQTHAVSNNSERDRINMVIDCVANDWLKNLIGASQSFCYSHAELGQVLL